MIKLIQSSRLKLPIVYLVETREDLWSLPLGIPFIRAKIDEYDKCVQMMEWEVLWLSAKDTGLPFNWNRILTEAGYKTWKYGIAKSSFEDYEIVGDKTLSTTSCTEEDFGTESIDCSNFLNDISYKVDIDIIKELKLLPVWLEDIEEAVKENIVNSITYNPTLYTKKLDLPLGGVEYSPGLKNIIIIDISGSIPRGVSSTMLGLAKTLAEQFYADVMITGSKSTLYDYADIDSLDVKGVYSENGMDNDQIHFRKLLEEPRRYKTAIVFGDNDNPGHRWTNNYNKGANSISDKQGKDLCKWQINDMISFHVHDHDKIAGYGRWFDTEKITHIKDWARDLN